MHPRIKAIYFERKNALSNDKKILLARWKQLHFFIWFLSTSLCHSWHSFDRRSLSLSLVTYADLSSRLQVYLDSLAIEFCLVYLTFFYSSQPYLIFCIALCANQEWLKLLTFQNVSHWKMLMIWLLMRDRDKKLFTNNFELMFLNLFLLNCTVDNNLPWLIAFFPPNLCTWPFCRCFWLRLVINLMSRQMYTNGVLNIENVSWLIF